MACQCLLYVYIERSDGSDPDTQTGLFFLPLYGGVKCERPKRVSLYLYYPSRVTRRVLNASCLRASLATSETASENDHGSPLSPSVRRREKCRVFAHWPHAVCYPVSERQFCCRLCYEHSCRLNLNTGFHASPDSNARSIQRPSNHSRRTTQNPRISIPQVQIAYRPLSGDWYVVYNLVGRDSRS
jgi:hypothetical protein